MGVLGQNIIGWIIALFAAILTYIVAHFVRKRKIQQDFTHWPDTIHIEPSEEAPVTALLSYTKGRIQLHGRKEEYRRLKKFFRKRKAKTLIWAVVGEAGSGKSKFAFETVNRFTKRRGNWKKIWWKNDENISEEWTKSNYPHNLILVVDYVASQAGELRELLCKLTVSRRHRLRILLLERENVNSRGNPAWLHTLLGESGNGKPHFQQLFYGLTNGYFTADSFLSLPALSEDALREILRDYWKSEDKARENRILEQAKRLTREGEAVTPLHLLMAASVGENANVEKREDLFDRLLEREDNRRKILCGDHAAGVKALLLYATLTGKWVFGQSKVPTALLSEDEQTDLIRFFREHPDRGTLFSALGGNDKELALYRISPDLMGEYFALDSLRFYPNEREMLLKALWEDEATHQGYFDFLDRAAADYPLNEILNEAVDDLPDTVEKARLLNTLGYKQNDLGNYSKAADLYEQALHIREKLLDKDYPLVADSYNNLGNAYDDLGDYPKAIELHEQALAIYRDKYGENHPATVSSYNNLGVAYRNLGDYPKAIEQYEKALAIQLRVLGENHPATASSYNNLGAAYGKQKQYELAMPCFQSAFSIALATIGSDHPYTQMYARNIARCAEDMGDTPTAERHTYFAEHGEFPDGRP